jgi:hypothetical protein
VSAQFEEIVVHTDLVKTQHVGPDSRQLCFEQRARRDVTEFAAFEVRRGQRLAIQFSVGGDRQVREHHIRTGRHMVGQMRLHVGAQFILNCGLQALIAAAGNDQVRH